jgi:putative DNA primase/helicase
LIIISNELPRLADASGALASRFIVLLLTRSFFGREDQTLTGKLLTELPGILNWGIAGWRRLTERGYFVQPGSALDAVQQLEDLGSPTRAFLRERCEIGPFHTVGIDELYIRLGANGAPSRARIIPAPSKLWAVTCSR